MENNKHAGNYTGTANMKAENQDLEFVNDVLENAPNTSAINLAKDDLSEGHEQKTLEQS